MAVVSLPTIRTQLTGDNITNADRSTSFTLGEKLENIYYLKASDVALTIDISKINNLKSMLFYSVSNFTLSITIDIGTTETPNVVIIPFTTTGNFRLDPDSTFISKVSSISLSTISTTDITIYVNIYGASA
jgi:hypothetical protein